MKTYKREFEIPIPDYTAMGASGAAQQKQLDAFFVQCQGCAALFVEKNHQYDNGIEEGGYLGALIEIMGIYKRLRAITRKHLHNTPGKILEDDKIFDLLMDLHNYSNIAAIMLGKGNILGGLE